MAFDIALIKEHPYATGGIVIVGGIIVFYLLSGSSSAPSSSATSSGASNQAALLQAQEAEAQINAGTQQQNAQTSAELQAASLQADAQNQATAASVAINQVNTEAQLASSIYGTQASLQATALNDNAATEQQANEAIFNQNTVAMQDSVLEDQINSGVVENANNNATAVAGAQIQAGVADLGLGDALTLAQQQESDQYNLTSQNETAYDAEIPYVVQHAGQKQNSIIDATDQTSLFQTVLAQGNPTVATAGTSATSTVARGSQAASTATNTSIASGISGLLNGLLG
jgi:hypothetical protein